MDLARDLVRLGGRDPESQPFEIVGLRPGEKLHEELFYDAERVEQTASAKVLKALAPPPPDDVREHVRRLLSMAGGADEPALSGALLDYVRADEGRARSRRSRPPWSPPTKSGPTSPDACGPRLPAWR